MRGDGRMGKGRRDRLEEESSSSESGDSCSESEPECSEGEPSTGGAVALALSLRLRIGLTRWWVVEVLACSTMFVRGRKSGLGECLDVGQEIRNDERDFPPIVEWRAYHMFV